MDILPVFQHGMLSDQTTLLWKICLEEQVQTTIQAVHFKLNTI
jgi:hypothetical protein